MTSPRTARSCFDRYKKRKQRELGFGFLNVMFMRFPLFDPDRFLVRALPAIGRLISPIGAVLWLIVVGFGVKVAVDNFRRAAPADRRRARARQPVPALRRTRAHQGAPRIRPRILLPEVRRRSARDGRHADDLHADPVRRRDVELGFFAIAGNACWSAAPA